jgi:hypothetical protein
MPSKTVAALAVWLVAGRAAAQPADEAPDEEGAVPLAEHREAPPPCNHRVARVLLPERHGDIGELEMRAGALWDEGAGAWLGGRAAYRGRHWWFVEAGWAPAYFGDAQATGERRVETAAALRGGLDHRWGALWAGPGLMISDRAPMVAEEPQRFRVGADIGGRLGSADGLHLACWLFVTRSRPERRDANSAGVGLFNLRLQIPLHARATLGLKAMGFDLTPVVGGEVRVRVRGDGGRGSVYVGAELMYGLIFSSESDAFGGWILAGLVEWRPGKVSTQARQ